MRVLQKITQLYREVKPIARHARLPRPIARSASGVAVQASLDVCGYREAAGRYGNIARKRTSFRVRSLNSFGA